MINRLFTAALFVLCLVGSVNASIIYPVNDGFELPNLKGGTSYRTQNATWTFNSPGGVGSTGNAPGSGITSNGSPLGLVNAEKANHNGGATTAKGQAAFIEGGDGTLNALTGAYFFQTINMPFSGTLQVRYYDQGESFNGVFDAVKVLLKQGSSLYNLGTYTPTTTTTFGVHTTPGVAVTSGDLVLYFIGVSKNGSCNSITFIDNVGLSLVGHPTPEPGSFVLFGMGVVGLFVVARRRRRA